MSARPIPQITAGSAEFQKILGQPRMDFQDFSQAIARILVRAVTGIFTPVLRNRLEIAAQRDAMHAEQWAHDPQSGDSRVGAHGGEAFRAAAATETVENGFRLIVGMMSENDSVEFFRIDHAHKQRQARGPISRGTIGGGARFARFDFAQADHVACEAKTCGKIGDELRIAGARASPCFMIKVCHVQAQFRALVQKAQQGNAVRPATHSNRPGAASDRLDRGSQRGI